MATRFFNGILKVLPAVCRANVVLVRSRSSFYSYNATHLYGNALHTSSYFFKSKSKSKPRAIEQLIRPVDAAIILDLEEVQETIKQVVTRLQEDFAKEFRVGSDIALGQLSIKIEGDSYDLNELAQITKQSTKMIQVDMVNFPEYVNTVEDAIRNGKWQLNPSVVGTIIKVPIPHVTAEHRTAIAKAAKQRLGACKVEINEIIRSYEKLITKHENINENLDRTLKQQIKIYKEHFVKDAEDLYKGKENEIMSPS